MRSLSAVSTLSVRFFLTHNIAMTSKWGRFTQHQGLNVKKFSWRDEKGRKTALGERRDKRGSGVHFVKNITTGMTAI
jgi:hypothetical protein